jgi:hypothetical protein
MYTHIFKGGSADQIDHLRPRQIDHLEWLLQKCKSRTSLKNFESAAWVAPKVENSNRLLNSLKEPSGFLHKLNEKVRSFCDMYVGELRY